MDLALAVARVRSGACIHASWKAGGGDPGNMRATVYCIHPGHQLYNIAAIDTHIIAPGYCFSRRMRLGFAHPAVDIDSIEIATASKRSNGPGSRIPILLHLNVGGCTAEAKYSEIRRDYHENFLRLNFEAMSIRLYCR